MCWCNPSVRTPCCGDSCHASMGGIVKCPFHGHPSGAATPEPAPVPVAGGVSMHDLVAQDLAERKAFGLRKYGTLLQAGNGRDALMDAYQEVLDLAVYLRQRIEEDRARCPNPPRAV